MGSLLKSSLSKEWVDELSTGSWLDNTVDKSHPSGNVSNLMSGKCGSVPNTLPFSDPHFPAPTSSTGTETSLSSLGMSPP